MQLVATGALTNVALLLILYPEVGSMIDITLMGGALGVGGAPAAVRQPRVLCWPVVRQGTSGCCFTGIPSYPCRQHWPSARVQHPGAAEGRSS